MTNYYLALSKCGGYHCAEHCKCDVPSYFHFQRTFIALNDTRFVQPSKILIITKKF